MMRRILSLCSLVLAATSVAEAQTIRTVAASGANHTTINACLAVAVAGDTCSVAAGETFGAFELPNKGNLASPITIRSNTADANLPAAGVRVVPDTHAAVMPNIQAGGGGVPALTVAAGAQDYIILGLEFMPNPGGYVSVIELGSNATSQRLVADQPGDIVLDRVIVRGDPVVGQKVGVDLNGRNLTIKNSHVDRIAGLGQDAIAVRCINGSGPLLIENNYLESAAYNFICGGDDPQMRTSALVSAGANTTQATLNTFVNAGGIASSIATLSVGQLIALKALSGTTYHFTYVRSISTNTITYDAIPSAPDTGAGSDARWGVITNGITFRNNHVRKPIEWLNPILSTPTSVSAVASTASGTLAAGTYCYRVVAQQTAGYQANTISSAAAPEVCTILSATGKVDLSWTAVANASRYRVYGRATGAPTGYLDTTGTTVSDTGTLTTGTIPSASRWQVKNLWEIKHGTNVLVTGNIFEYSWPGSDIGYAIWLKSNNNGGSCEFCQTKDLIFEKNIIRHVPGGFNILARINTGANISPPLENVTIRNNLLYDSTTQWLQGSPTTYLAKIEGPVRNLTLDHNTFLNHTGRGFLYLIGSNSETKTGLVVTNNLARRETYGVFCGSLGGVSASQGTSCLNLHTTNSAYTFAGNVLSGASPSAYPANNRYDTDAFFQAEFVRYGSGVDGDYALTSGSVYRLTGTDGLDRGADIPSLNAATANTISGGGSGATVPINITTTGALTGATQGTAYTFTLLYSGGTGAVTWTNPSGSLPAGLTLSSAGVISGTPTTLGTASFQVRVTDSAGVPQVDTQTVSITVAAAPVALDITTTSPLTGGTVPIAYSVTLAATGGTAPYTWTVTSGALPAGLSLSTSGVLSGVPTTAGVASFTVTATDSVGATDAQAYSLTIAAEAPGCSRSTSIVGGITLQVASFAGPTAPTNCVRVGDKWMNTSMSPAQEYVATAASPSAAWALKSTVSTGAHGILSATHSDAVTATLQAGDILVATEDASGAIRLDRVAIGPAGTVATSTGDGVRWAAPASGGTVATGAPAVQTLTMYAGTAATNTNVPGGGTEFVASGRYRMRADVENSTQIAVLAYFVQACSTSPAAVLRIEYWDGAAWQPTGATSPCSTGLKENAFVTLAAGARTQDRVFRAYYSDGDALADPSLSILLLRFR